MHYTSTVAARRGPLVQNTNKENNLEEHGDRFLPSTRAATISNSVAALESLFFDTTKGRQFI